MMNKEINTKLMEHLKIIVSKNNKDHIAVKKDEIESTNNVLTHFKKPIHCPKHPRSKNISFVNDKKISFCIDAS